MNTINQNKLTMLALLLFGAMAHASSLEWKPQTQAQTAFNCGNANPKVKVLPRPAQAPELPSKWLLAVTGSDGGCIKQPSKPWHPIPPTHPNWNRPPSIV